MATNNKVLQISKETKDLLLKEAALSSMNLGVGLTFLRKYDFSSLGYIYQGFFSISVGLERLIKLILLHEYLYTNNGAYPPFDYLKSRGHNINKLFIEAEKLSAKYQCTSYFDKINKDPIYRIILSNLSDFATANRYFNLDKLSGGTRTDDPVSRWNEEVNSIIISRHFRHNHPKHELVRALAQQLKDTMTLRFRDENSREMQYDDTIEASLQIETKQKYSMYYTYCIVKALCEMQVNQTYSSHMEIFLHEFFTVFRREYISALRIKTWNPHSPYRF